MWEDLEDLWTRQERLSAQLSEEERTVQIYLDDAVAEVAEATDLTEEVVRKVLTAWESGRRKSFLERVFEHREEQEILADSCC